MEYGHEIQQRFFRGHLGQINRHCRIGRFAVFPDKAVQKPHHAAEMVLMTMADEDFADVGIGYAAAENQRLDRLAGIDQVVLALADDQVGGIGTRPRRIAGRSAQRDQFHFSDHSASIRLVEPATVNGAQERQLRICSGPMTPTCPSKNSAFAFRSCRAYGA